MLPATPRFIQSVPSGDRGEFRAPFRGVSGRVGLSNLWEPGHVPRWPACHCLLSPEITCLMQSRRALPGVPVREPVSAPCHGAVGEATRQAVSCLGVTGAPEPRDLEQHVGGASLPASPFGGWRDSLVGPGRLHWSLPVTKGLPGPCARGPLHGAGASDFIRARGTGRACGTELVFCDLICHFVTFYL